jgi:bacteriocin biosynthesis cyclodehydratase domain-containing protein
MRADTVLRPVHLVGSGRLHGAITELLGRDAGVVATIGEPDELRAGAVVVSAEDGWDPATELARQRRYRDRRVRWLHCRIEGNLGFVGPLVRPWRRGCVACAETRRRLVIATVRSPDGVTARPTPAVGGGTAPWLDSLARVTLDVVARGAAVADGKVYVQRGDDLAGRWHTFVPIAGCRHCGGLPDDGPELVAAHPEPRVRASKSGFRVAVAAPATERLRESLHDWRYGLVPHVFRSGSAAPALSVAEVPLVGRATREAGYGRAPSFDEAEQVALLEAMERYSGWAPTARRTVVDGTFEELADDAVDPTSLGLPDPSAAEGQRWYVPYTPTLRMPWVWAWSLTRQEAVLVPECSAYWGVSSALGGGRRVRYCDETSNGCALGASFEEATIHGIFEVAERDGFLMAWHRWSVAGEIDVATVPDDFTQALVERAECAGYRLRLFDVTTDLAVPAVWALLYRDDGRIPASFTAGGANPDPVAAVRAAVVEVVVDLFNGLHPSRQVDEARLRELYEDDDAVVSLDDHIAAYTYPDALERLDFALSGRVGGPARPLREVFRGYPARWERDDLRDTLQALVDHVASIGLDVLVVDQTPPEQVQLGLRSVKVIIPGTVPMTFGHVNRRLWGIPRLVAGLRGVDDLNHRPHPFP